MVTADPGARGEGRKLPIEFDPRWDYVPHFEGTMIPPLGGHVSTTQCTERGLRPT